MSMANKATSLCCLLIKTNLEVLCLPFSLSVASNKECNTIFAFLRVSAPSLRGTLDSDFSLYRPHTTMPSRRWHCLTEKEIDTDDPVDLTNEVHGIFPGTPTGNPTVNTIDTIICIACKANGTFSPTD
jgi:hypothetical protein